MLPPFATPHTHRRYRTTANKKKKEDRAKTKEKKDNQDLMGQVATADENFASRQRHSLQLHASVESAKMYDAREWFANVYPELVIIAVTDGHFRTSTGEFCLNMYGLSCKTVRAYMLDAWNLRNVVYRPLHKQGFDPEIKPRCRFSIFFDDAVMVGGITDMYEEDTPPHKSITLRKGVSTDGTEFHTFDWMEQVSGQVEALRKAIQACYNTGVNQRQRVDGIAPDLSMERAIELIEKHIVDMEIKRNFMSIMRKKTMIHMMVLDATNHHRQQSILQGTFYTSVSSSIAAWWMKEVVELGFGGSHFVVPFQRRLVDYLISRAPNRKDILSRMLLAWAGADGSIKPTYFEVIVPFDESHDSVRQWMMEIFDELCSVVPYPQVQPSKVENGKDITKLRIHTRDDMFSLAKVLLPYTTAPDYQYINRSRKEGLNAMIEMG
jgi:hypothetical protein